MTFDDLICASQTITSTNIWQQTFSFKKNQFQELERQAIWTSTPVSNLILYLSSFPEEKTPQQHDAAFHHISHRLKRKEVDITTHTEHVENHVFFSYIFNNNLLQCVGLSIRNPIKYTELCCDATQEGNAHMYDILFLSLCCLGPRALPLSFLHAPVVPACARSLLSV